MIKPEELFLSKALKLTCETKSQGGASQSQGRLNAPPTPLEKNPEDCNITKGPQVSLSV